MNEATVTITKCDGSCSYTTTIDLLDTIDVFIRKVNWIPFVNTTKSKFFFRGVLLDDQKTLQQNGVTHGSKLYHTDKISASEEPSVFINSYQGILCELPVMLSKTTVTDVKNVINQKLSIPQDQILLICCGEELEDSQMVGSYIFNNYATFHLYLRPSGEICISVQLRKRDPFNVTLFSDYTVYHLKTIIEKITNMNAQDQSLFHNGIEMKNDARVSNYNLHEGDVVELFSIEGFNILGNEDFLEVDEGEKSSISSGSSSCPEFEVIEDEDIPTTDGSTQGIKFDMKMFKENEPVKASEGKNFNVRSEEFRPSLKETDHLEQSYKPITFDFSPKDFSTDNSFDKNDRLGFKRQMAWFSTISTSKSVNNVMKQKKKYNFCVPNDYNFQPKSSRQPSERALRKLFQNLPGVEVFSPRKLSTSKSASSDLSNKINFDVPDVCMFYPLVCSIRPGQTQCEEEPIETKIADDFQKLRLFPSTDHQPVKLYFHNSQPFPITVKTLDDNEYKLTVDTFDSVRDLKLQLVEKIGLPVPNQRLILRGTELENVWTLSHYHVCKTDILYVVPRRENSAERIYVQTLFRKIIKLNVKPNEEIRSLKLRIQLMTGFSMNKQRLFFEGIELKSGNRLIDYEIENDSILDIKVM